MRFDRESASATDVREAMSRLVTGVVVATTQTRKGPFGMTINSLTSITFEPPIVLICLNTANRGYQAILESGSYAANILGGSHQWIARRFATPGLSNKQRFDGVETRVATTGSPIIRAAAGWLDCRVVDIQYLGTHGLFFGQVAAAAQDELDEVPLAYYQRKMYPLGVPES
ncbi:MAG: flavin reductase family protein [Nocardioides sp.]|uniref:flavin reductase family protein n=1 Tax=Nocardioides sp. TaxID=35761 RepID=UPI0039E5BC49